MGRVTLPKKIALLVVTIALAIVIILGLGILSKGLSGGPIRTILLVMGGVIAFMAINEYDRRKKGSSKK